jgi:hypothetical protein
VLLVKVQVDPERLELGNEPVIGQNCTPVSVETRLRALELDLHRLDELFNTYFPKAWVVRRSGQ